MVRLDHHISVSGLVEFLAESVLGLREGVMIDSLRPADRLCDDSDISMACSASHLSSSALDKWYTTPAKEKSISWQCGMQSKDCSVIIY